VGYHTERFRIEVGQQVGVQIGLKEKIANLSEVFVTPGTNPALALMDSVRLHRERNQQPIAQQHLNMHTALYVSNLQAKHLQRNLWKSMQAGMLSAEDSTFLIPLYWRQQQADNIQEKATLLTITDYQILLSDLQATCNFYNNHINLLSVSMLSPLATSGDSYYQYYLADSMRVDNEKHYVIHFHTKNPFYATFNGEMTIDSASFALRNIQASVPAQTSINFLRHMTIQQSFMPNNQLAQEDLSLLLDFAIKADTTRTFPTLFLTRNTQVPAQQTAYSGSTQPSSTPELIQHAATNIEQAMDSIDNTP
jgi:hypothetical protein